ICAGQNANLNANAGFVTYSWSPGAGNTQATSVSPAVTTTYTVTVTDGNGCQGSDDVIVTVNPLPVADAGADQQMCIGGGPVNLRSEERRVGKECTPGGSNTHDKTVSTAATTIYTVTVTDANCCQGPDNR